MALRVLVAPDSYKGSATAAEIANAMVEGLSGTWRDASFDIVPMSDGGDGFLEAMVAACGGRVEDVRVKGPLGDPVQAKYGVLPDGTAVIEMAQASGLRLVARKDLDPLRATTYGTGQLIRAAIGRGASRMLVGVGGSATNDGGAGMAEALGVAFLDRHGNTLSGCPSDLANLESVDLSRLDPAVSSGAASITVACDVETVLCGELGASRIFGPQKGASPEMVDACDRILDHYAGIVERAVGRSLRNVPGAGAAGGLAFGLMAFLGAELRPGFEVVSAAVGLDKRMRDSDIVFTGEGRTDGQTQYGKTVSGVVKRAAACGVPVVVLSGGIDQEGCGGFLENRMVAVASIAPGPISLEESMADAVRIVRDAARRTARIIDIGAHLERRGAF